MAPLHEPPAAGCGNPRRSFLFGKRCLRWPQRERFVRAGSHLWVGGRQGPRLS
jgi:hypothetical protein